MSWQPNLFAIALCLSAAISICVALFAWTRQNVPGVIAFVILMMAAASWLLGYALEIGSQNPLTTVWALRIQFLGTDIIPVAWFSFAALYTRRAWFTPRIVLAASVLPLLTTIMVWSAHLHGWMWAIVIPGSETGFVQVDLSGPFSVSILSPQTWYWVDVGYGYLMLLAGLLIFIRALIREPQFYREHGVALVVGVALPWISNTLVLFIPGVFGGLDPTPFVLTLSSLIFAWSIFRLGLFTILPTAYTNVIENMRDAVFILDARGKILRLNPAAENLLGQPATKLFNTAAVDVFTASPQLVEHLNDIEATDEIVWVTLGVRHEYDLRVSPLYDARRALTGRLIILRDITERKRGESALRQSNVDLERRVAERTDQLEQINHILRQVANRQALLFHSLRSMSQSLDVDSVARTTVTMIAQLTQWKNVCLVLPSDPPTHWKIVAAMGTLESEIDIPYPMTAGIIGRTFRTGTTQLVDDTQIDPDYLETRNQIQCLSQLCIPVRRVARILAVLDFESPRPADFSPEDIELGESLAEAIALALDNALLFDSIQHELGERERTERELRLANEQLRQRQDELTAIYTIGRKLASTLDLHEIYQTIYSEIGVKLFNAANLLIALYNRETQIIHCDFAVADYGAIDASQFPPIALGQGPVSEVIRNRQPRLVNIQTAYTQANTSATEIGSGPSPKAGLYAPMVSGDQVIGVLQLQHYEADAFKESDLDLITTLANQAGIAIKNAQSHEQLQRELELRKRAELEREKLIKELETKNTELERFTYTVSHDLKSPLITIRGFLGFLEEDARAGNVERLKADIGRIVEATDKMQRLLNDLLELSRIGRIINPPELVSFGDLANEAVRLVEGRITARGVRVEIAPGLPHVYGDRVRLVEVVQNLVDNAVKFMGNQPEPFIRIGVRESENPPVFFVQDNGVGIDPKYYGKVFELFTKLNSQNEGTGIGLALVKRIIEVHGGRIWVESKGIDTGTSFCFTLPNMKSA